MSINVAKSAGFCFGVNRAIKMVEELLDQNVKVCTLGPIIHNMEVVRDLEKRGCRAVESIDDVKPDETLVIRSHGVPAKTIEEIKNNNIVFKDATCPFVKKIHNTVADADEQNDIVLIAGNSAHPEVQGIMGHCKAECYTFNNEEQLDEILNIILKKKIRTSKLLHRPHSIQKNGKNV